MRSVPAKTEEGHMLAKPLLPRLFDDPILSDFLFKVTDLCPQATVVGGAVRDSLINSEEYPADVDMVVLDGQYNQLIAELLKDPQADYGENRHGNARFYLEGVGYNDDPFHVDIWTPMRFYEGYANIDAMLSHFDLSINAVGVELVTGTVYDPVDGVDDLLQGRVRLLPTQWEPSEDVDYARHLITRLNSILDRYPQLRVTNPERALALIEHIAKAEKAEWEALKDPFSSVGVLKTQLTPAPLPEMKPKYIHPVSGMPTQYAQVPADDIYLPPLAPDALDHLKLSPPIAQELHGEWETEDEVCLQWMAGEKCPGCTNCPSKYDD
jgi:hypothetical protein